MEHTGGRVPVAYDDLENRKRMSFKQAEGIDPLPAQLKRTEMTAKLRSRLWNTIYSEICPSGNLSFNNIDEPWVSILRAEFINRRGRLAHTFQTNLALVVKDLSPIFEKGSYDEIYDLLQHLIRDHECPDIFVRKLEFVLSTEKAAYRLVFKDTLMPVSSEKELEAIRNAFIASSQKSFGGAHTHLRNSAEALSAGRFADSVRDSIHSVEAVARILEPEAELSKALSRLEKSVHIHKAMKLGFEKLYGYSSDEGGIRHALLEDGDAKVDEADAIFMIGACASFVSYLISKKNVAGI